MDDQGNILVKKLSGKNVYVKSVSNAGEETSIGADVLKLPNYCLETDKPVKVGTRRLIRDNYCYITRALPFDIGCAKSGRDTGGVRQGRAITSRTHIQRDFAQFEPIRRARRETSPSLLSGAG